MHSSPYPLIVEQFTIHGEGIFISNINSNLQSRTPAITLQSLLTMQLDSNLIPDASQKFTEIRHQVFYTDSVEGGRNALEAHAEVPVVSS